MKDLSILLARMLIVGIFLFTAIRNFIFMNDFRAYVESYNLPGTNFLVYSTLFIILAGSLSILLGYKTRLGALVLILFLIPITIIFHTHFADPVQVVHFFKNLGLIGGLLLISSSGAGKFSLNGR